MIVTPTATTPSAAFVTKYGPALTSMGAQVTPTDDTSVTAHFPDKIDAVFARHALNESVDGVKLLVTPQLPDSTVHGSPRYTNWAEVEMVGRIPGVQPSYASRSSAPPFETGATVESQEQLDLLRPLISESGDYHIGLSVRTADQQR